MGERYDKTRYYGKCFTLADCKAGISKLCIKQRCNNDIPKNMKNPVMYHIFAEVLKASAMHSTVRNAYNDFLTRLLNCNPCQAEESFQKGFTYLDNLDIKSFYFIESFFNVRLRIFQVQEQKKHSSSFTKKQRNKDHVALHNYPCNLCKKQTCYFITTKYMTNLDDLTIPNLNILISSLSHGIKNTNHTLCVIPSETFSEFMLTFEPLMGLSNDIILFERIRYLDKDNQKFLGIRFKDCVGCEDTCTCYSGELKIIDLINNNSNILCKDVNLVFISSRCFIGNQTESSLTWHNIEKVYRLLSMYKFKTDAPTKVLIINPVTEDDVYNILYSGHSSITKIFEYGPKNDMVSIKTMKNLKINKKKEHRTKLDFCPCETFGNKEGSLLNQEYDFKSIYQYPLKFNKKSFPTYFSLFGLDKVDGFNERVKLASRISNLFFDIESLAEKVLLEKETDPGIYLGYQELKNMIHGYHRIIMIGYEDTLNDEIHAWYNEHCTTESLDLILKKESWRTILHLGNNVQSDIIEEPTFEKQTQLVKEFIELLFHRSRLIKNVKLKLLEPIIDYISNLLEIETECINSVEEQEPEKKFNSNNKTETHKLKWALDQFLNETVLWGFNSSKYDNVIIMPYLKYLLNNEKSSLFYYKNWSIFRRGRIISNLSLCYDDIKITFRDFLNIENPYTSLEDMAKKYNIPHSKAVFPHKVSESIKKLKTTTSIPVNEKYWTTMSGEIISKAKRADAIESFKKANVNNMYEYMTYYLYLDVTVLKECFFAYQELLFSTEEWDITANKSYTISSLMYEKNYKHQFKSDWSKMSVFEIKNKFIKTVLDHSIIGGITINMFSGLIGTNPQTDTTDVMINSHLKYGDVKSINKKWAGLYKYKEILRKRLNKSDDDDLIEAKFPARFIHSYDMLSLYASAMYHAIPIGPCRQWNYGYIDFENQFAINCPCRIDYEKDQKIDSMFHRSNSITDTEEARFIYTYLHNFNHEKYQIEQVSSALHVGGPVTFEYKSTPDLFIKAIDRETKNLCYFIINYDGVYFHGIHKSNCVKFNIHDTLTQLEKQKESDKKHKRREKYYKKIFENRNDQIINVVYEVITSCDMGYCSEKQKIIDNRFFFNINNKSLTSHEMKQLILTQKIRGFVVVRNLKIEACDQNPSLGFAVQKTDINSAWVSEHTKNEIQEYTKKMGISYQNTLKEILSREKILCLHEYVRPTTLHTDYLIFLHDNFIINLDYELLHVLEFCHDNLLKEKVDSYIKRRFEVKDKIKMLEKYDPKSPNISYLNAVSSVLKLYNNSLYGYTLLRPDNYKSAKFIISHRLDFINKDNIVRARLVKKVSKKNFIIMIERKSQPSTTQAHVGSTIMTRSKITFLSSVLFLLLTADPALLECLYMDTDSIHFCTYFKLLEDNIIAEKKNFFLENKKKYFYHTGSSQLCGVLDLESIAKTHRYITEKMYQKVTEKQMHTACKGVNRFFKKKFLEEEREENIFSTRNSDKVFKVNSHLILADIEDNIITKEVTKTFGVGLIPTKRYFLSSGHSKTYKVGESI